MPIIIFPTTTVLYRRMAAMREAIGPDVKLAMDGNLRMSVAEAARLCDLCEELSHYNDPKNLAHLRARIRIPIAAAENEKFSALDLLSAGAVD